MLEHVFRNINDIRVFDIFDIMTEFPEEENMDDDSACDIYEIMDMLEYPEYKRIEVEDSIKHLVENEVLGIKKIEINGMTGCKTCKWTDKLKLPRIGEHKTHKPEKVTKGEIDNYFMKSNDLTQLLRAAVFRHVTLMVEKDGLINKEEKMD